VPTSTAQPPTAQPPTDGGPTSSTSRLSLEVGRLIRSSHGLRAQLHGKYTDGVEWAGYQLLIQLCKGGPQRSSTLATSSCIDPSTVSRQVADLVAQGLVERRADPDDGRASLLAATELGEARHRAIHDRRNRAFAYLLADWPADDVETLAALLSRLNDSMTEHRASLLEAITGADETAATESAPDSALLEENA
jgi:DNA-binding MarR family transcriptional regulator